MKLVAVLLFFFCGVAAHTQTLPNFDLIHLEKPVDFKKAEPFALLTANFLLSNPFEKENKERLNGLQFLGKWMNGTPDYSFAITDMVEKIGKDSHELLGLYMVAMAKYMLENKEVAKDTKLVKLNAMKLLLDYCGNKANNIRMSRPLKKLAEAHEKGQLEQAL